MLSNRFVRKHYLHSDHHKMSRPTTDATKEASDIFVPSKSRLGPSKYGSILGFNKFESAEELSAKLQDGYWTTSNKCLQYGIDHEPMAIEHYERLMKTKVLPAGWITQLPVNGQRRICGKADGLIGKDGGVEIKCHYSGQICKEIPKWHLPQVLGYMFMYDRQWWDFMSCIFDDQHQLIECYIHRVYRSDYEDLWSKWWKTIRLFCIHQWKKISRNTLKKAVSK